MTKLTVTLKTQAQILPTKTLSTFEIYNLAKTVAGNSFTLTIEDSDTVQQLANAADALMKIDPEVTINEKVLDNRGNVLNLGSTLKQAGLKNDDVVFYKFSIRA
jgi:phage tail sheath gpL-like